MLLLHGEEDVRTPFIGAEEFVKALQEQGKEFDYHWYKKEGHGNVKLENQVDEWQRIEAFLRKNL
jgi:dipeptidyl aminopeptidase/acylaminoacyl peptidase